MTALPISARSFWDQVGPFIMRRRRWLNVGGPLWTRETAGGFRKLPSKTLAHGFTNPNPRSTGRARGARRRRGGTVCARLRARRPEDQQDVVHRVPASPAERHDRAVSTGALAGRQPRTGLGGVVRKNLRGPPRRREGPACGNRKSPATRPPQEPPAKGHPGRRQASPRANQG